MTVFSGEPAELPPLWERRWFGPGAVAAAAVAMLVWTWGSWPDLLVDFGVQLYVPWQLSSGEVLYRDIAHYTGPLSVYLNAAVFWAFGPSLLALVAANLPVLGGIIAAIYFICLKMAGRAAAIAGGLSFVVLFAFAHLMPIGNYNYVCPYEYEYTHGMLLCLGTVIFVWRLLKYGKTFDAAAAGFLVGLVFLTRAEFFVADFGVAGLGLVLLARENQAPRRRFWFVVWNFANAACIPVVASALLLACAMPLREALRGTAGMWPALLAGRVTQLQFYRHSMGFDNPRHSLHELIAWSGVYLGVAAILMAWGRCVGKKWGMVNAVAAGLAGIVLIAWRWRDVDWISAFRPLPLVALAVMVAGIVVRWRRKSDEAALAALMGTLALLLLGKIILYARIEHYGCWLGMPATMLLVAALFGWIGDGVRMGGGNARVYFAGITGVWGAVLIVHLAITGAAIGKLKVTVGSGGDAFLADGRGVYVNRAVGLVRRIRPDQTVGCFPEGIMINYLARRRTPTAYVNFNPPDLLLFGESNMVAALRAHPPDYVLIVQKETSEFGVKFFGADYGKALYGWIAGHYREKPAGADLGFEPLRDNRFGMRLMAPDGGGSMSR